MRPTLRVTLETHDKVFSFQFSPHDPIAQVIEEIVTALHTLGWIRT